MNKLLIANRGEIARRIMRTCREMGIATVAVCSDSDRDEPFVREADEVVPLGGSRPGESYLVIEKIIDAARKTGADAVHPGYGFLAENAEFARQCGEAGLIFVGPSADVIAAMGSKIEAKRLMQEADIPVLPQVTVTGQAAKAIQDAVGQLEWPLLVKASAGGGGRGMRIVVSPDELNNALETARQEAESAFGDGTLFIEPYIESSRHIEVQIFGDTHGNVIYLFERECSIQRRHQKIIEECPSPAVDDELRAQLCEAAVRAGKQIGYVGAGTVEFLLTEAGQFYFLEVNTRLQVEHPVTECVTGLDLVRLQLLVAQGEPLSVEAMNATITGHAIEARLYAEDPANDYLPAAGRLHRCRFPNDRNLRVDSGIDDTSEVSPFYDPMLAKVIAHAPTRREASLRLASGLADTQIHGLRTNRELLVRVLRHPEFLARQTDTHFLQRHDVAQLAAPLGGDSAIRLHATAAALASQSERRREAEVLTTFPSGWRNNASQDQRTVFTSGDVELTVAYRFGRDGLRLAVNGEELQAPQLVSCSADNVTLETAGVQRTYVVHRVGETVYVDSSLGSTTLVEMPRFPEAATDAITGSLTAPLPGVVSEVLVSIGDTVAEGDVLVVIESMKVLHRIAASQTGKVSQLSVKAGETVQAGAVLAMIDDETS
ncbi:MAG: biotin/lipoyl-binding protein [Planctomycetaceae bacterium]|nr:biotin/lipoyl-binding protein [Planctomycetaceae bacterium]